MTNLTDAHEAILRHIRRLRGMDAPEPVRIHGLRRGTQPRTFTWAGEGQRWVFLNPPCNPFAAVEEKP